MKWTSKDGVSVLLITGHMALISGIEHKPRCNIREGEEKKKGRGREREGVGRPYLVIVFKDISVEITTNSGITDTTRGQHPCLQEWIVQVGEGQEYTCICIKGCVCPLHRIHCRCELCEGRQGYGVKRSIQVMKAVANTAME